MNITDKLYTEWAWRTKTGVPDINNPEDKVILDSLINELTNTDGVVSKQEVVAAIEGGKFTPDELKTILNGISGVAYKKDVLEYLNTKGKAVSSSARRIYNTLVDNGDIQNFHTYVRGGKMVDYASLGTKGNLKAKFTNLVSQDTLNYLMDLKPSIGNIATGKGEVFLSVLVSDVSSDSGGKGDVAAGGLGVEVKNKGAVPMGQKAGFGKNTDKVMIDKIISGVNSFLIRKIDTSVTKGNRPFHRINKIIAAVLDQNKNKLDDTIEIANRAILSSYPGIDFEGFNLTKYKSGNGIDADKLESHFVKKVIDKYVQDEDFDQVFFLDDSSGNYTKVQAGDLNKLAGNKISINMKDGLPRWTYNF